MSAGKRSIATSNALAGRNLVVVGAGIAGLATAMALARRGARVEVHEQAEALREVGAGLQVSPNGFFVLDALGLGAEARELGLRNQAVTLRDHRRGARVARLNMDDAPFFFLHRADLLGLLERGARQAGVTLRLGHQVNPATDLPDADLVVGADGARSQLRDQIQGAEAVGFSGQVAWRALVPQTDDSIPPEAQVFLGPGRHLVAYPLRQGRLLNLVAVEERADWAAEGWRHSGDPDDLRRAFADFGGPVPGWLHDVTEAKLWGLFLRPVARTWARDRMVLVGDAAHPTLPFLAQGACLGLEDGWALAACLAQDWDTGPQTFQDLREGRARRVVNAAHANARNYHLRSPLIRLGAHTGLRVIDRLAPRLLLAKFAWLYGYDVTKHGV